jgi:hypothetical protein
MLSEANSRFTARGSAQRLLWRKRDRSCSSNCRNLKKGRPAEHFAYTCFRSWQEPLGKQVEADRSAAGLKVGEA